MGAAAVALDIIIAEPDRTGPRALAATWPEGPEWQAARNAVASLPDPDEVLAQSLKKLPSVGAFAAVDHPGGRLPVLKAGFALAGDNPGAAAPEFVSATASLPIIEAAATGLGSVNILPETDGVVRRVPMLVRIQDQLYPSLALELLRVVQGVSGYVVKGAGASGEGKSHGSTAIAAIRVGDFAIPTDGAGGLLLYDSGVKPGRHVPAWRILDGSSDPHAVEGALVLIGASATALQDQRTTPLASAMPGVEIHAQLIEQILNRQFLRRPGWAPGAELLATLSFGAFLILLLRKAGALRSALIATLLTAAGIGGSVFAFIRLGWLIDPVTLALAAVFVYIVSSILGRLKTERDRRQVRDAFARYLSPILVDQLARHPERLALGGENRELTLLFTDIRDFTSFSEEMDPAELGRFMNGFLTPMTAMIHAHRGTIDKYIGDCIMAFWNAPLDDPDHAAHALEAALAMRGTLDAFNAAAPQRKPIQIGIGINTGVCAVGNFGSDQRFDYSALGDTVNAASRFESLSKHYGVDIVVGESTAERCRHRFALLPLDRIRVKGKTRPVLLHALLGGAETLATPEFERVAAAQKELLSAYRERRWTEAKHQAATLRALDPRLSRLALLYEERIESCLDHPPVPDWDGIAIATAKQG